MFSVFSKLIAPVFGHSVLLHIWGRHKLTIEVFSDFCKYLPTEKTGCLFFLYPSEDLN